MIPRLFAIVIASGTIIGAVLGWIFYDESGQDV